MQCLLKVISWWARVVEHVRHLACVCCLSLLLSSDHAFSDAWNAVLDNMSHVS